MYIPYCNEKDLLLSLLLLYIQTFGLIYFAFTVDFVSLLSMLNSIVHKGKVIHKK